MPARLRIEPPLLNAACPWASDLSFLKPLWASPSTGAITTRTSLVNGYPHNDAVNTFLFYDPSDSSSSTSRDPPAFMPSSDTLTGSLNCFGLSPHPLAQYLAWIRDIDQLPNPNDKLIVVSVTGETPDLNAEAVRRVIAFSSEISVRLAVEINLSCPNVPNRPPPAYDDGELREFLAALPADSPIPIGLKTTPYTHPGQFRMLVNAVKDSGKISFITAANTLGSSVVTDARGRAILPSEGGFGGLAGPAIHPLALGNVVSLRKMFDEAGVDIQIIGVGGVADVNGYRRMRGVGADFVAVATALGKQGPAVFDHIVAGIGKETKVFDSVRARL